MRATGMPRGAVLWALLQYAGDIAAAYRTLASARGDVGHLLRDARTWPVAADIALLAGAPADDASLAGAADVEARRDFLRKVTLWEPSNETHTSV